MSHEPRVGSVLIQAQGGDTITSDDDFDQEARNDRYGRKNVYSSLQPDAHVFKTQVDYDGLTDKTRVKLRGSLEKKDYGGDIFTVMSKRT